MELRNDGSLVLPARCFICERALEDGEPSVFSHFNFEPDWPSRLTGTKMVCLTCCKVLGQAAGFVVQSVEDRQVEANQWADDVQGLQAQVEVLKQQLDKDNRILELERKLKERLTNPTTRAARVG